MPEAGTEYKYSTSCFNLVSSIVRSNVPVEYLIVLLYVTYLNIVASSVCSNKWSYNFNRGEREAYYILSVCTVPGTGTYVGYKYCTNRQTYFISCSLYSCYVVFV
jgi:hypothetical protein